MLCIAEELVAQAPVLLRLAFHDAGTFSSSQGQGGANGSVRFELKRPENSGLGRGWKVIEQAKQVNFTLPKLCERYAYSCSLNVFL